jgi:hypothetical protein
MCQCIPLDRLLEPAAAGYGACREVSRASRYRRRDAAARQLAACRVWRGSKSVPQSVGNGADRKIFCGSGWRDATAAGAGVNRQAKWISGFQMSLARFPNSCIARAAASPRPDPILRSAGIWPYLRAANPSIELRRAPACRTIGARCEVKLAVWGRARLDECIETFGPSHHEELAFKLPNGVPGNRTETSSCRRHRSLGVG